MPVHKLKEVNQSLSELDKLKADNLRLKMANLNLQRQLADIQARNFGSQLLNEQQEFIKSLDIPEDKEFDWQTLSVKDKK